jgi:hypothetical protein
MMVWAKTVQARRRKRRGNLLLLALLTFATTRRCVLACVGLV